MTLQQNKWEHYISGSILVLLLAYAIVNPFAHTTSIQEVSYYGSLFLAIILTFMGKRDWLAERTPIRLPVILFVLWVLIAYFWAVDKANSRHDIYSHLLRYVILYILLVNFFTTRKKLKLLTWSFSISIVIFMGYSLIHYYLIEGNTITTRFIGNTSGMTYDLLGIPAIISIFFIICNCLTGSSKVRYFSIILVLPLVTGLILSQARSSFLALSLSVFFFLFFHNKRLIIPAGVILLVLAVFFTPLKNRLDAASVKNIRIAHGLLCLRVFADYPFAGIGFGMETFGKSLDLAAYKETVEKKYKVNYRVANVLTDPHNMYTDILVRTGIAGFIMYMYFIFSLFRMLSFVRLVGDNYLKIWALGLASSLLAYFFVGLFEPVFNHMHEFNLTIMISLVSILWMQCHIVEPTNAGKLTSDMFTKFNFNSI